MTLSPLSLPASTPHPITIDTVFYMMLGLWFAFALLFGFIGFILKDHLCWIKRVEKEYDLIEKDYSHLMRQLGILIQIEDQQYDALGKLISHNLKEDDLK